MTKTTLDLSDIPNVLKIAEAAARDAGSYLIEQLGNATVKYQKSLRDDLLDVDLEAENIIITRLNKEAPYLGVLSEEAGNGGRQDQHWIIDPLDGSTNFQHSNPTFAVAIALAVSQTTIAGVIYLPTSNEMFTAIQNQGAYLNGQQINVSQTATLGNAIIHIGDFTKENDPQTSDEGLKDFSKLVTQIRRVRMIGTAAADLAYVSCGRAEALINHATHPWDIEAGKLLLLEAGGKVTTLERQNGKPVTIYSNNFLHQAIKELLKD